MTFPFIRNLIHRPELPSTSDLAREFLADPNLELPLVVLADCQTRGRGRGQHTWWSDRGSLTFTLALAPRQQGLGVAHEPRVALTTAIAVIDAVHREHPVVPLGIRWPNDIESGGRKLGGILPERVDTDHGPRLLIGVGLNVLTRLDNAAPEVRNMATALAELGAVPSGPEPLLTLLGDILRRFGEILPRLAQDDPALADRWSRLDALQGQAIRIDLGSRIVSGTAAGIDREGALLLTTREHETHRLFGGQVLR